MGDNRNMMDPSFVSFYMKFISLLALKTPILSNIRFFQFLLYVVSRKSQRLGKGDTKGYYHGH